MKKKYEEKFFKDALILRKNKKVLDKDIGKLTDHLRPKFTKKDKKVKDGTN